MAETDVFRGGTRRFQPLNAFGTSRGGFVGGGTNPLGNAEAATSDQVSGINAPISPLHAVTADRTGGADRSGIPSFNIPKPPGVGSQVGAAVATKVATEGVKKGVGYLGKALGFGSDTYAPGPRSFADGSTSDTPGFGLGPRPDSSGVQDMFSPSSDSLSRSLAPASGGSSPVDNYEFNGSDFSGGTDLGVGGGGFSGGGGFDASGFNGSDFSGGVDLGLDAAAGGFEGIPYIGAAFNLSEGKVGSAIGGLIGSVFGPIGSIAGSFLGGLFDDSVICTELLRQGAISMRTARHNHLMPISAQTRRGYHVWGIPFVRLMRRSSKATALGRWMIVHRGMEIAYRSGLQQHADWQGKAIIAVTHSLSWAIGAFVGEQDYKSLYTTQGA